MVVVTRAREIALFNHVVDNVLDLRDSAIKRALRRDGITGVYDLLHVDEDVLADLLDPGTGDDAATERIPAHHEAQIKCFQTFVAARLSEGNPIGDAWAEITREEFNEFRLSFGAHVPQTMQSKDNGKDLEREVLQYVLDDLMQLEKDHQIRSFVKSEKLHGILDLRDLVSESEWSQDERRGTLDYVDKEILYAAWRYLQHHQCIALIAPQETAKRCQAWLGTSGGDFRTWCVERGFPIPKNRDCDTSTHLEPVTETSTNKVRADELADSLDTVTDPNDDDIDFIKASTHTSTLSNDSSQSNGFGENERPSYGEHELTDELIGSDATDVVDGFDSKTCMVPSEVSIDFGESESTDTCTSPDDFSVIRLHNLLAEDGNWDAAIWTCAPPDESPTQIYVSCVHGCVADGEPYSPMDETSTTVPGIDVNNILSKKHVPDCLLCSKMGFVHDATMLLMDDTTGYIILLMVRPTPVGEPPPLACKFPPNPSLLAIHLSALAPIDGEMLSYPVVSTVAEPTWCHAGRGPTAQAAVVQLYKARLTNALIWLRGAMISTAEKGCPERASPSRGYLCLHDGQQLRTLDVFRDTGKTVCVFDIRRDKSTACRVRDSALYKTLGSKQLQDIEMRLMRFKTMVSQAQSCSSNVGHLNIWCDADWCARDTVICAFEIRRGKAEPFVGSWCFRRNKDVCVFDIRRDKATAHGPNGLVCESDGDSFHSSLVLISPVGRLPWNGEQLSQRVIDDACWNVLVTKRHRRESKSVHGERDEELFRPHACPGIRSCICQVMHVERKGSDRKHKGLLPLGFLVQ